MAFLPFYLALMAAVTFAFPAAHSNRVPMGPYARSLSAHSKPLYPRNDTSAIPVARAGVVLNQAAAAEANPRDDTATRAFSSKAIKSAGGQCLFIDPTAGDFRENLIPVQLRACDGSANQQFDIITKGKHNNSPGSMLVVSVATQGCLNFDPRRAPGDRVILFSCGGRADGEGQMTDSQLFSFTAGKTSTALVPKNGNAATCLVPANGKLNDAGCDQKADQLFHIG